jgi:microcystin degradation protein MlrC
VTRKLRVGYARINQETNALSPVRTTLEDFRAMHFLDGDALQRATERFGNEVPGFLRSAELKGFRRALREDKSAEAVPLLSAWTMPSGPLSHEAFTHLRGMFTRALHANGPLDALYLCLHGAMGAEGITDPDTELVRAAREALGDHTPIAVSMDLHANVTNERVRLAEFLVGYHTNPHRDQARTGRSAGAGLVRIARGEVRPCKAWRTLPLLLGGGATLDFWPPMRAVFQRMKAMERDRRVLDASTFMVHPWLDAPEVGWSVVVTTDGDQALAEALADELAERCWAVRDVKPPRFHSPEEAIAIARGHWLLRRTGAVVLSDASDVVNAGATGDATGLLGALLAHAQGLRCYFPLRDPRAAGVLWGHRLGDRVTLELGGSVDSARHRPLTVEGIVRRLEAHAAYKRLAVLEVGHVQVVITDRPPLTIRPSFYGDVGLDPWRADIVVVKNFFPFRLFYLPLARRTLYVKSGGITDLDAAFTIPTIRAPVYPRDPVEDWRVVDRRRRGVSV